MIPRVYTAINAVAAALSKQGIPKERLNARDDYLYRSVDDVLARISPLLAEHRLCILPRVSKRKAINRLEENGQLLISVAVKAAFEFVSAEDGSSHVVEVWGEALDGGDKGTAKAMQSAYKYAVLQAFCVPVALAEDADARSHRLAAHQPLAPEPEQGWLEWVQEADNRLQLCTTPAEVGRMLEENRASLTALSRERPELYQQFGQTIAKRRTQLAGASPRLVETPARQPRPPKPDRKRHGTKANGSAVHG